MRSAVLEGHVRDVTDAGDSVVETEQGIVLVTGGLPGERVRVRTEQARAGVLRGDLLAVLTPASDRIEPVCRITERCGGCPVMSLQLESQWQLKKRRVERAVEGLCADGVSVQLEAAGEPVGYRRRARMAFRRVGQGLVLGYHAHGSRQLVDVEQCPVLTPELDAALAHVRTLLGPLLMGVGVLELDGLSAERVAVSISCESAQSAEAYRAAEQLASTTPIAVVALRVGEGAPALFGDQSTPQLARDGLPITVPRHGFSQVNAAVNTRLAQRVLELAEPQAARVLELYAGHGNFTLELAAHAAQLLAVEADERAVEACRQNLRVREQKQARVLMADVRQFNVRERFDVLVLDPPRGGCPALATLAQQTRPARVVYISCHMTTLQRDLRALHAAGYVADRVHALDMFPQTGHVEAIVRMRRVVS
ncbi:MAG: hypothetical protein RLZZ450_7088 [Pseudomonadota bacterium]